jgi:putative ABC transport system ATP-binding protein
VREVIRAEEVWKQYRPGPGNDEAALRGASLRVTSGEAVALLGKSGSGKTTLLNLLAGLDRPTGGKIEVEGRDLEKMGEGERTLLRRHRIGFIFQFFNLLPTLTAFENVFLSLELAGKADSRAAAESLARVGLEGKGARYPHELSGGEQQRVAIARAIVKEPGIILADEPTGNLDTGTGDQVLALLARQCRQAGAALILATHAPLTSRYADRVLRIADGVVSEEPSSTR